MKPDFSNYLEVIASQVKAAEPDADAVLEHPFDELGVDSLAMVNLIVELENALGITMPDEILTPEAFASPGTLWKALEPHVANSEQ